MAESYQTERLAALGPTVMLFRFSKPILRHHLMGMREGVK